MATGGYIFQCGKSELFAVSSDMRGANIPAGDCPQGWVLRDVVRLDQAEPLLLPLDTAQVRQVVELHGFYIWRESELPGNVKPLRPWS